MSRKVNLDLDTDSLKVIDPNQKPLDENESNNLIDPNQVKLENADIVSANTLKQENKIAKETSNTQWIDANQMSLNDEQNKINNLSVNDFKNKNKSFNAKSLMIATIFVNLFFVVWLFVLSMVKPLADNVGNITVMYVKNTQDSNLLSLTPAAYVNLFLFTIPTLALNIANLILMKKNNLSYFSSLNKKARISFTIFRVFMLLTIILLSVNLWIPPLSLLKKDCSFFNLMYDANINITIGWYVIIVVFSISISSYFITLIVLSLLQSSWLNFEKMKERREVMKKFFEEVKKAKQTKKENKNKKKLILAEEEKLLSNLQEVSEEEKALISEEEFQARIKSNNEIRNKIKDLQKQQEELRRQQSVFMKKKRQEETINRRPLKPKKQEITIPDKELEEIFKNIELD